MRRLPCLPCQPREPHDLQRLIRQRPLQRLRLVPGRTHPRVSLFICRQDHGHRLRMDRLHNRIRRDGQEAIDLVRPELVRPKLSGGMRSRAGDASPPHTAHDRVARCREEHRRIGGCTQIPAIQEASGDELSGGFFLECPCGGQPDVNRASAHVGLTHFDITPLVPRPAACPHRRAPDRQGKPDGRLIWPRRGSGGW